MAERLSKMLADAEADGTLDIEVATVAFALEVEKHLRRTGISASELAARIGVKPPTISRVLGGNQNVTIATMARIARALNTQLTLKLSSRADQAKAVSSIVSHYSCTIPMATTMKSLGSKDFKYAKDFKYTFSTSANHNSAANDNEAEPVAA